METEVRTDWAPCCRRNSRSRSKQSQLGPAKAADVASKVRSLKYNQSRANEEHKSVSAKQYRCRLVIEALDNEFLPVNKELEVVNDHIVHCNARSDEDQ